MGKDQRSLLRKSEISRNISSKHWQNKRNGKDLKEENIKKRWKKYAELYKKQNKQKKHLKGLDNHVGVVTHPKPDILECEIKWALGSTAADIVEVMEFQLSYLTLKR